MKDEKLEKVPIMHLTIWLVDTRMHKSLYCHDMDVINHVATSRLLRAGFNRVS